MFGGAFQEAREQAQHWKHQFDVRFTTLARSLTNMLPARSDNRSSTPSFFDRGLPPFKPLPSVPEMDEVRAPSPLKQRRLLAGSVAPDPDRKRPRPLTWFEAQFNSLQKQNQELRQDIIAERRHAVEKDRLIVTLRQQNDSLQKQVSQHIRRENQHDDLLKQFASTMQVALEDLRDQEPVSRDTIDDFITVYCDTDK